MQVHHLAGDYTSALDCLLQQPRGAAVAFGYIAAALRGGRTAARVPPGRQPALRAAALAAMPRLVAADAAAAARLVLRDFPGEHAAVVANLAAEPRLQYRYLKGAMEVCLASYCSLNHIRDHAIDISHCCRNLHSFYRAPSGHASHKPRAGERGAPCSYL